MPVNKIANFSLEMIQILDENGNIDEILVPKLSDGDIKDLYRLMVQTRIFDEKAWKLQRQGRISTYAPIKGQEASDVGTSFALSKDDWIFPTYRNMGAYITKGMPMEKLLQYWGGDEKGQKIPDNVNTFTLAIPVGTQPLHAVGYAWAAKKRKKNIVVLTYMGEAATSTGDFHEAMNFAGVFNLPVIFVVENNQYAISVPRIKQTRSKTIAQKAIAYGFDGVQVDGNDVFAVIKATKDAIEKAKQDKGPTLIECVTYRIGHHTTADDYTRYRTEEEVQNWVQKDPIERLRKYMENKKLWTKEFGDKILKEAEENVEKAVTAMESLPKPRPDEFFDYVFAEQTKNLKEQREYLLKSLEEREKEVRFP